MADRDGKGPRARSPRAKGKKAGMGRGNCQLGKRLTRPGKVRPKGSHIIDEIKFDDGKMIWKDRVVSKDEWEKTYGK